MMGIFNRLTTEYVVWSNICEVVLIDWVLIVYSGRIKSLLRLTGQERLPLFKGKYAEIEYVYKESTIPYFLL